MGSLTIEQIHKTLSSLGLNIIEFKTFIETGTFIGTTIMGLYSNFSKLYTIEIDKKLSNFCSKRAESLNINNIEFINNNSKDGLRNLFNTNASNNKTIFFLDGHYSGDNGVPNNMLVHKKELGDSIYKTSANEPKWKKNRVVVKTGKLLDKDVPLYDELEVIDKYHKSECIIIIDDLRLFGREWHHGDWSNINTDSIKKKFINRSITKELMIEDTYVLYIA